MENASKALLMAGAILLAILIIAIGMFIYNSAQSTINNSMQSMSTQEVQAFNNEFNNIEGETKYKLSDKNEIDIKQRKVYNKITTKN